MQVAIFLCNKETMAECLAKELFGSSASYAKTVRKGDILLLYNKTERILYGVWVAASNQGTFDSRAWGGGYPNQVRVAQASAKILRLPQYCFGHLLGDGEGWGKAVTGSKGHNLLQYFAFEYQGTLGLGVPLQDIERNYREKHSAQFKCTDGHRVRLKEEQLIDNWLSRLKIPHAYEILIAIPPAQLVPAFVVHKPTGEMICIEFVGGSGDPSLEARRRRNNGIYSEQKLPVVALSEADVKSLDECLGSRLRQLGVHPAPCADALCRDVEY